MPGQGRWSGFRLISGFPMAAPVAGLPMPDLIGGRLAAGREVGVYVFPRGVLLAAILGLSNELFCCGAVVASTDWFFLRPSLVSCIAGIRTRPTSALLRALIADRPEPLITIRPLTLAPGPSCFPNSLLHGRASG